MQGHVGKIITSDFHKNGYHLVTGGNDNILRFYDLRKKSTFKVLPAHNKLISHVEFSKIDGYSFLSSSYDTTCKIWSIKDWKIVKTLYHPNSKLTCVSLSPDEKLISTTSLDSKWTIWEQGINAEEFEF